MEPLDPEVVPPSTLRPLRRAEYDRLVAAGVFDDERLELLYGRLVAMRPQGQRHVWSVRRLNNLLAVAVAGRAQVQCQGPVAASDESEPEPDVVILPPGDFLDDHAHDALLVIEVADSSRLKDLRLKARLYAEMGIADYWVLDLSRDELVVHRGPEAGRYGEVVSHGAGAAVAPLAFPDVVVRVAEILPPAPAATP
ncbi:MAG: Uma2 family endonuclease [Kofleriaceae bacterium]|nr:Uma2 family endonuclease [Myxococcales bacterium]MCB9561438.1 Uma2 family endonuclease [Kofleriaceae bacterium]MCB9573492.1 Uma2 family endonuclease [Kofleriaceae bacterium]